ncbi:cytochrome c oxidase subunit 5B, mitochondrial isoform X2 [Myotis lucifugus]|uniref:cytochrome c oxidase subunit 5B, mitochondrial isoform X2 n=1 Tax=Myotis lucifugus TaxID=59463 RepID=UPI000CCC8E8E|nr:cytochrome c oxidase subunit 5B, mitochondrial isoform X2 [Myotis lucifugus]
MASRLLRGTGALVAQALRARGPNAAAAVRSMASAGGVPTDDEQATGLEREVMLAARKGLVKRTTVLSSGSGCTKARPSDALAVEPIISWCPTSCPTEPCTDSVRMCCKVSCFR